MIEWIWCFRVGGTISGRGKALLDFEKENLWLKKIKGNMERDAKTDAELAGLGWKVLRFWSRDVLKKNRTVS